LLIKHKLIIQTNKKQTENGVDTHIVCILHSVQCNCGILMSIQCRKYDFGSLDLTR